MWGLIRAFNHITFDDEDCRCSRAGKSVRRGGSQSKPARRHFRTGSQALVSEPQGRPPPWTVSGCSQGRPPQAPLVPAGMPSRRRTRPTSPAHGDALLRSERCPLLRRAGHRSGGAPPSSPRTGAADVDPDPVQPSPAVARLGSSGGKVSEEAGDQWGSAQAIHVGRDARAGLEPGQFRKLIRVGGRTWWRRGRRLHERTDRDRHQRPARRATGHGRRRLPRQPEGSCPTANPGREPAAARPAPWATPGPAAPTSTNVALTS
jgi:hypothetical protein